MPPRVKCGANYINSRYAFLEARRHGYDVPILLNSHGLVSESSGACVAIVRAGKVVTPPTSAGTLESITRDSLLQLADSVGIKIEVRDVDRSELYLADEVFLCGTAAEVTPVVSVDGSVIGDGKPGPVTCQLLGLLLKAATGRIATFSPWLTEVTRDAI
jgi:branched-chain amino acid aminotransferase